MKNRSSNPEMVTCNLTVEGMDCPSCEKTVRGVVEAIPGYEKLETNYFEKALKLTAPEGFDFPAVIKQIENMGYKTSGFAPGSNGSDAAAELEEKKFARYLPAAGLILSVSLIVLALALKLNSMPEVYYIPMFLVAIAFSGIRIFHKGLKAILSLSLDMNSLMTIAVCGAMLIGEWFEGATVIFLASIANYLEAWSMERSRKAVKKLMELSPHTATVVMDSQLLEKPVEEIFPGEIILIRPGAKVPLDAEVIEGESWLDQAPVTGESVPVSKMPGDELFAGSINSEGIIKARVTSSAQDSTIARIIHLVQEAQANKAPTERFINKFAAVYTPVAVSLAVFIAVVPPLFSGDWLAWLYRALVLLVIACPCALVISTPVGIISGLSAAAKAGILIKGGSYLEKATEIDHVVFDKTGTLTLGIPEVTGIRSFNKSFSEENILALCASLEKHSEHHIARAIIKAAEARNLNMQEVEENKVVPGKGVTGIIDGKEYFAGNSRVFPENAAFQKELKLNENPGETGVLLGTRQEILGIIHLADQLRPESAQVIADLQSRNIKISLLSGDNEGAVALVSDKTGISDSYANLLPEDKLLKINELTGKSRMLVMVGDGINDAPSLAAADIGIAMGEGGTDVALETADMALMSDQLQLIPFVVDHSQRTMRIIRQNIVFSIATKIIFILLSVFGLSSLWMAVLADTGLSLLVTSNSLRLLKSHPAKKGSNL